MFRRAAGRLGLPTILADCTANISVSLMQRPDQNGTVAKEISLEIFNNKCKLVFHPESEEVSIRVNDYKWSSSSALAGTICEIDQGRLIPKVTFSRIREIDGARVSARTDPLRLVAIREMKSRVHGRTSLEKIMDMHQGMAIGPDDLMYKNMKALDAPQSWRDFLHNNGPESIHFAQLKAKIIASRLLVILDWLAEELDRYFLGVRYLKPLRASAERYYRYQELAVDEIDPEGANLPMFLDSLSKKRLKSFGDWTEKYLGGRVSVAKTEGHISLLFAAPGEEPNNVADMGFGISQVLPIAAQLWLASSDSHEEMALNGNPATCLVVEQPELHLHPEYQARLADLFVAVAQDSKVDTPKMIIETHSPHLINRLGHLLSEDVIDPNLVQIVIFEQPDNSIETNVRVATFDSRGALTNWPVGFFDPSYY